MHRKRRVLVVLFLALVGLLGLPRLHLDSGLTTGGEVLLALVVAGCGVALYQTAARPVPEAAPAPEVAEVQAASEAAALITPEPPPPPPARPPRPKRLHRARHQRQPATEQEATRRLAKAQAELDRARAAYERQERTLRQQELLERNLVARLRNTLALIAGYAEMLTEEQLGELASTQKYPMLIIHRRARQLVSIIEDLETLLQASEPELPKGQVDLVKLVQDTLHAFEPECRNAHLTLNSALTLNTPPIQGHPEHLRRVLENLLSNARKFTPEGGTITVRLTHTPQEVLLQVSDTGIGIPEHELERIFERFYQVADSRRQGGSGLGLALVKEVVQAHGGRVTVESAVGRGTTFSVYLPLKQEEGVPRAG